jgi:hypothetical protein
MLYRATGANCPWKGKESCKEAAVCGLMQDSFGGIRRIRIAVLAMPYSRGLAVQRV